MEIVPLVDEGLGNSSYLLDLGDGRALALDPTRDPRWYQNEAARRGLRIAFTVETHLHADFVSGSCELAVGGAEVLAPRAGTVDFAHRPLGAGDEVDLGGLTLRSLPSPGHTPEHLAYLLLDGQRPLALFSGGALLPGGAARTDLIDPDRTKTLTRSLWRSARSAFGDLPDDLTVYPTHGVGSFCSAGDVGGRTTTLGAERRSNLLFGPDKDRFVSTFSPVSAATRPTSAACERSTGPDRGSSAHPRPSGPWISATSGRPCTTGPSWSTGDPSTASRPATSRGRSRSSCGLRSPAGSAGSSKTRNDR